jgi:sulfur-carrier protein
MAPRVKVRLFHELRTNVGQSELELEANTLNELVQILIRRYSSMKELLFDSQGKFREYIFVYINNVVQAPTILSRKLNDGDLILLVPSAAGGKG